MIKIFFLNKTIYLINSRKLYQIKEGAVLASIKSKDEMHLIHDELINKNNVNEIYFFNKDIKLLFNFFSTMFLIIEAAGGVVKNKNDEWLFIFRNGKWDLPKGKIEKNESIKTAAIREVKEECGIRDLKIIKKISTTFHAYFLEEKAILKPTYWYEMFCNDQSKLVPQREEGITDAKWLNKNDFKMVYKNTYDSIKDVMSFIT